jgi:hypothetical protein
VYLQPLNISEKHERSEGPIFHSSLNSPYIMTALICVFFVFSVYSLWGQGIRFVSEHKLWWLVLGVWVKGYLYNWQSLTLVVFEKVFPEYVSISIGLGTEGQCSPVRVDITQSTDVLERTKRRGMESSLFLLELVHPSSFALRHQSSMFLAFYTSSFLGSQVWPRTEHLHHLLSWVLQLGSCISSDISAPIIVWANSPNYLSVYLSS